MVVRFDNSNSIRIISCTNFSKISRLTNTLYPLSLQRLYCRLHASLSSKSQESCQTGCETELSVSSHVSPNTHAITGYLERGARKVSLKCKFCLQAMEKQPQANENGLLFYPGGEFRRHTIEEARSLASVHIRQGLYLSKMKAIRWLTQIRSLRTSVSVPSRENSHRTCWLQFVADSVLGSHPCMPLQSLIG